MDLTKIENTNIYEFKSSGRLTEQDAKNLTQSFKEFKKNKQKIKLLGIIEETPLPKNFSTLDDLVKLKTSAISVLEKYAIISHKEWVDNFITIGNFFTPGLPIKSFKTEDREEAINWLQKENIKEHNPKDYLSNIEIKKLNPNIFEININHKKINHAAMTAIYNLISNQENDEKLNIMIIFESFPSFDSLKALIEGLKIDFKAIGSIKKYAVVSDAKYIESYTKIGDFMTPGLAMKFFDKDEIEKARNWIMDQ